MNDDKNGQIVRLKNRIGALDHTISIDDFSALALTVFSFQYQHNPLYQRFVDLLGYRPEQVQRIQDIPLLPISAFKHHLIQTGQWSPQTVFYSSGTTRQKRSTHLIADTNFYFQISRRCCESVLKINLEQTCFLGLLPSYLEQGHSSLVAMVDYFMRSSLRAGNAFYLSDFAGLHTQLMRNRDESIPTVLFGVSFALLEFIKTFKVDFEELLIIETGGMKGRGEELVREELHRRLSGGFNGKIISEYGMTELLSQAYMVEDYLFKPGPSMAVRIVDRDDPLSATRGGKSGLLGVIDLANVQTCSFILTDDLGVQQESGLFSVLGRADHSEWRGCNLMLADIAG